MAKIDIFDNPGLSPTTGGHCGTGAANHRPRPTQAVPMSAALSEKPALDEAS